MKLLKGKLALKNPKYELFVKEYLTDYNKTRSAREAGYSEKSAKIMGQNLFKKTEVANRIKYLEDKKAADLNLTDAWVVERLMALSDGIGIYDHEEIRASDRIAALKLLGMNRAMFVERREIIDKPKRIIIRDTNNKIIEEIGEPGEEEV